ncbi:transposase-like protein [Caldalkalibacillus uzonensis]|uniref:Mutator family transposase n=1 Tax=Caldalkalibacillus uzonensis TaxID=353224 RepID=A0ABU0CXN0_9BACI|nr:transposase-like protein [Caldalkalibacillus uzonensis]
MLEGELEDSLGYAKHDQESKATSNRRNGYSKKKVRSDDGESEIKVPRDREGEFEPAIVKKHQSNVTGIEDQIIAMYAGNEYARYPGSPKPIIRHRRLAYTHF